MAKSDQDRVIAKIVKMENRLNKCTRCKEIRVCSYRPSTGKGELDTDILMVFPNECSNLWDKKEFLRLRQEIAVMAGGNAGVYHTYMVRCMPRVCMRRSDKEGIFEGLLMGPNHKCLLTGDSCDAMLVQPDDQQIMNCLHFLLEEIEILRPDIIITVGERTYQYVFRAFGLLDPFQKPFDEIKNKLFRSGDLFLINADLPYPGDQEKFADLKPIFELIASR